ncbi:MAG: alpha/beta hydrolase [Syntrophobacteraceae bacterium]|nr:alpha/beta hydrolase [Syntrophobacteraceae bacterium]
MNISAPHDPSKFRFARIALETSVSIHYAQRGEGGQLPVIFLHGFVDSWRSFAGVFEAFPRRIVAPDLRGHGDSDKPECCYEVEDYTGDLVLLLDALGLHKVDLVGHSLGSFIAQRFSARFPERVRRLVLISSAPSIAGKASLPAVKPVIDALSDPVPKSFAAEFQATSNPVATGFMEMIVSETMKVPAHVWRSAFSGLLRMDHRPILRKIGAPTLLLWGNQDQMFTRLDQEELLCEIADSRLEELDAGHSPHWEKPKEIARALEKFLG